MKRKKNREEVDDGDGGVREVGGDSERFNFYQQWCFLDVAVTMAGIGVNGE